MGMDVYGKAPTNEKGEYFRNNVWWWHPLAQYVCAVAPEITAKCKYWHSNDGDGLGKRDSLALAKLLRAELASGACTAYQVAYEARLDAIPNQKCDLCEGTGVRTDKVGLDMLQHRMLIPTCETDTQRPEYAHTFDPKHPRKGQQGWCNGCNGTGEREPWEKNYPFSAENVQEFCEFLESCGGFRID